MPGPILERSLNHCEGLFTDRSGTAGEFDGQEAVAVRADDCELVYVLTGAGEQIAPVLGLHVSIELEYVFWRQLQSAELVWRERIGEFGFDDDPSIVCFRDRVCFHSRKQCHGARRATRRRPPTAAS